ncbi:hypothetical protein [Streptomyces sp. SID2563]|uniref:hypothetical protein n=1 Tax=Streptomyces sp. SID2563 TaxID=2690255 RepID=UPI001927B292|nr:hypothetical protein [Streptomyces sp. SID2563]
MLEELAVGAQHRIPYVLVLVNDSYLGMAIRLYAEARPGGSATFRTQQQLTVDGDTVYAKSELLGMSLVSVVRGRGGDWPTARAAQRA